jgi:hypothetical protein
VIGISRPSAAMRNIGFAIQVNRCAIDPGADESDARDQRWMCRSVFMKSGNWRRQTSCEIRVDGKDGVVAAVDGHKPMDVVDAYASLRVAEQKQVTINMRMGRQRLRFGHRRCRAR